MWAHPPAYASKPTKCSFFQQLFGCGDRNDFFVARHWSPNSNSSSPSASAFPLADAPPPRPTSSLRSVRRLRAYRQRFFRRRPKSPPINFLLSKMARFSVLAKHARIDLFHFFEAVRSRRPAAAWCARRGRRSPPLGAAPAAGPIRPAPKGAPPSTAPSGHAMPPACRTRPTARPNTPQASKWASRGWDRCASSTIFTASRLMSVQRAQRIQHQLAVLFREHLDPSAEFQIDDVHRLFADIENDCVGPCRSPRGDDVPRSPTRCSIFGKAPFRLVRQNVIGRIPARARRMSSGCSSVATSQNVPCLFSSAPFPRARAPWSPSTAKGEDS